MKAETTTKDFYSDLYLHTDSLSELFEKEAHFVAVPQDWYVVITDIVGSTNAVKGGRHEEVNLIATGSIVALLNIAFGLNVTVPFFFGGDGATFIVPPFIIDKAMEALLQYKINTLENFNLELRAGIVSVENIYKEGHQIQIAKCSVSKSFSIPIVLGSGLGYAEEIIKGKEYIASHQKAKEEELDLTGMQCRWDKIAPPEDKEEIVSLLVIARNASQQAAVYGKVLSKIDTLYGFLEKRQPISIPKLKLNTTFNRLSREMRARMIRIRWFELIRTWIVTLYGYFYFSTRKGKNYLRSLVEMSDTLVVDGKINTVISGTVSQRKILQELLDEMEAAGELIYGLHSSSSSIMSCYVRDSKDGHIHFVDGSEGGYTQAAKMIKAKISSLRN